MRKPRHAGWSYPVRHEGRDERHALCVCATLKSLAFRVLACLALFYIVLLCLSAPHFLSRMLHSLIVADMKGLHLTVQYTVVGFNEH
jgi:hypothetical protein